MSKRSKVALVLAGGGVAGVAYHIGAVRALDTLLANTTVNDFDLYVGTSAGALVCAALAAGMSSHELFERAAFALHEGGELGPGKLFSPNLRSFVQRGRRFGSLMVSRVAHYVRHPSRFSPVDLAWDLLEGLPSGFYQSPRLARFFEQALLEREVSRFVDLQRELYIIATILDTGERAVFGLPPLDHVPIAQAIAASAAVPLVFQPVEIDGVAYIDGGLRGPASLDIAIERGAGLIICINPLVPLDNSRGTFGRPLSQAGPQAIGGQSFRTLFYAGLHYQLKQLRRRYPDVDILVIEPDRDDISVFEDPILRFGSRCALMQHACESVSSNIAAHYERYHALLERHGLVLDQPALRRQSSSQEAARVVRLRTVLADLEQALDGF